MNEKIMMKLLKKILFVFLIFCYCVTFIDSCYWLWAKSQFPLSVKGTFIGIFSLFYLIIAFMMKCELWD